jgi:hypothetical protein
MRQPVRSSNQSGVLFFGSVAGKLVLSVTSGAK